VSYATFNSKSFKTAPSFEAGVAMRDLVAAMPIVMFANAVRVALQRRTGACVPARTAQSN
jgi:hypothetical protein